MLRVERALDRLVREKLLKGYENSPTVEDPHKLPAIYNAGITSVKISCMRVLVLSTLYCKAYVVPEHSYFAEWWGY